MSKLLRYYADGQIYFITCVTANRVPVLIDNIQLFYDAVRTTRRCLVFRIGPYVIQPDHFHWIIDPLDCNLSDIMHGIKVSFAKKVRSGDRYAGPIWQKRFWDHIIRDEDDFNVHADYIHYNPIKHLLVDVLGEWPHSSFARFCEAGYYSPDWRMKEGAEPEGDFGE